MRKNYFGQDLGEHKTVSLQATRRAAANSSYKKLEVQWLIEALSFEIAKFL